MMYPPAINHGHGTSPLYGFVFPSKPPSLPGFSIARFDYQGVFQDVLPNRPASLGQAASCRSAAYFFCWDPTTFRLCPTRPWNTPYKVYVICNWLVVSECIWYCYDQWQVFMFFRVVETIRPSRYIPRHIQTIRSRRGSSRIFHPLILSSLVETGAWPTTDNEMRRNP